MSHRFRHVAASVVLLLGVAAASARAQIGETSVTLKWTAPGDDSLSGTAARYELRWSRGPINTLADFTLATPVAVVPQPQPPGSTQSATVIGLTPRTAYWIALVTYDEVNHGSALSNVVQATTLPSTDVERPSPLRMGLQATTPSSVTLTWTDVGDDSLAGTATEVEIRWATAPIDETSWPAATPVFGEPPPGPPGTPHQLTVNGLDRSQALWFAGRARDDVNYVSGIDSSLAVPRFASGPGGGVSGWSAGAPFPNPSPVGGDVTLPLDVPASGPFDAVVEIQNTAGEHVRTLRVSGASPGPYALRWDGRNDAGRDCAPGVYRAWLKAGDGPQLVRIMRTP